MRTLVFVLLAASAQAETLSTNFQCSAGVGIGPPAITSADTACSLFAGTRTDGNWASSSTGSSYSIPSTFLGNTFTATVSLQALAMASNPCCTGTNSSDAQASFSWSMMASTGGPIRPGMILLDLAVINNPGGTTSTALGSAQVGQYACNGSCVQYQPGWPARPFTLGVPFLLTISDFVSAGAWAMVPIGTSESKVSLSFTLLEADGVTAAAVAPTPEPRTLLLIPAVLFLWHRKRHRLIHPRAIGSRLQWGAAARKSS